MNFGFSGSESEWQVIQPAFDSDSPNRLLASVIDGKGPATLAPDARRYGDFGELLANAQLDAVILGGQIGERASRVRQVLQIGRHCVCMHPADTSPLFYHEAALIAQDHGSTLMPWLPARLHPACQALVELCQSGILGATRFITIERTGPMPIDRYLLAASYAEAVDLLWFLGGDVAEISSTGDANAGRLVVHHRMTGGAAGEIRLQRTSEEDDYWAVAIDTDRSATRLTFRNGFEGPATLRYTDQSRTHEREYAAQGLAVSLLSEFRNAVHNQSHAIKWSDATRAAELADWAWYSLEKRRAVDIFHEERGELASFKGRMTSLGCGLIWITLLVVIVIAAGQGLHLPGMDILAAATAVVWLLFLVFQALRWTLPAEKQSDQSS
jgi:predicted dehydrogenase